MRAKQILCRIEGEDCGSSKMHLSSLVAKAAVLSAAVVLLLLVHSKLLLPLFVRVLCLFFDCYSVLCVLSSFAVSLVRKRELIALLLLSF